MRIEGAPHRVTRRVPPRLWPRAATGMALVGACLLVLAASAPTQAQSDEGFAYDLARDVMSPFCPGRTLAACPSPQAAELIQWIALQEQAGASREEVEGILYERYGNVMRSAPKAEGWGLAAYVVPLIAALVGIGVVVIVIRRLAQPPPESAVAVGVAAADAVKDDELERIVDEELGRI